jgi:hypothetical protein
MEASREYVTVCLELGVGHFLDTPSRNRIGVTVVYGRCIIDRIGLPTFERSCRDPHHTAGSVVSGGVHHLGEGMLSITDNLTVGAAVHFVDHQILRRSERDAEQQRE